MMPHQIRTPVTRTPGAEPNYINGIPILTGNLLSVSGTFRQATGKGEVFLVNSVTSYDKKYIQTEPTSNQPIFNTTYDTILRLPTSLDASVPVGDPIGDIPYTHLASDLLFKADANTLFAAEPEEGPIACRFTGGGVDTDMNWDHTLEDGEMVRNGSGNIPEGIDRAQFGGQASEGRIRHCHHNPQANGPIISRQARLGISPSIVVHTVRRKVLR